MKTKKVVNCRSGNWRGSIISQMTDISVNCRERVKKAVVF